ncbi:hypothetical protein AB1I91_10280 [Bacillus paranthracis]|uniref:hypothetical protein n=1 Tax=Bacillus paranthracis TaxID=2026186 RepID=UPI000778748E|nr:hypothetical protein [Bacillus paranthracis]KXY02297.1 hypothetical protein AT271_15090 [Bacillus cereus]MDG1605784.1 hypothetical protein [Bacillus paranthracis]
MEFTQQEIAEEYKKLLMEIAEWSPSYKKDLRDLRLFEKMIAKRYGKYFLAELLERVQREIQEEK